MKTEDEIIRHINNMKVAMELMKATNDISQTGINGIELGLKGLLELIEQFKKLEGIIKILPTDEEIKELIITEHYHYEKGRYRKVRLDRIQGAKIVRDFIKNRIEKGNKFEEQLTKQ